jgi:hypothetical protein
MIFGRGRRGKGDKEDKVDKGEKLFSLVDQNEETVTIFSIDTRSLKIS